MCCGKKRISAAIPQLHVARATRPASRAVMFEYTGGGSLTVTGPVTGRRYQFASYGARVAVDPRDRLSVRAVPHLREVRQT